MSAARPPDNAAQAAPDEPRDARLQAALREAPDHALQPPAALAQSIRAAAHAAVKPPAPRPWWAGLHRAWQALAAPRPVWAGATAALLVSVLTVRLWVDEPVPPAVEVAAPALPAAAPAAPVPAPAPAPAPAPVPAEMRKATPKASTDAPAKPKADQKVAAPSPARESTPALSAPKAEAREARAADDDAAAAAAPARNDMARQRTAGPAPAVTPAAPLPAPAPVAAGLAKAIAPQRPGTLDAWLLAARSEADQPAWPLTPQQRRLLRLLVPADDSRWMAAPPAASAPAPALREAEPAPLVWPSPRGTATLLLLPTGLRWTEPDGSVWILPLSAEQLQRLRQAL